MICWWERVEKSDQADLKIDNGITIYSDKKRGECNLKFQPCWKCWQLINNTCPKLVY